jgi:prevent-host-death family protein
MLTQINTHEAKTHLSKLLVRVQAGEEIIIAKAGKPIAKLVPIEGHALSRSPGSARGLVSMAPDFDQPLPDEVLDRFER